MRLTNRSCPVCDHPITGHSAQVGGIRYVCSAPDCDCRRYCTSQMASR